jgi:mannose-6-phosphate isomerase-like protein (cupin superfamily)
MIFSITEGHSITEAEAIAEFESMGLHTLALDFVARREDWHRHEFSTIVHVIAGTGRIEFEGAGVTTFGPGCRAVVPAGTVHREFIGSPYRVVLGFDRKPSGFTQPVDKPVEARS